MKNANETHRTIKVPVNKLSDEVWVELRRAAFVSASFCNEHLNAFYAQVKGLPDKALAAKDEVYRNYNDRLSSAVRDALTREVQGMWKRNGKMILNGQQTLARFTADRCLTIRCDKGAVKLTRQADDDYRIEVPIKPPKDNNAIGFQVWAPALAKDHYLKSTLDRIIAGVYRLAKASILFERPGRKVFVMLSFAKPAESGEAGKHSAEMVCDEEFWLRCNHRALSLGDQIHHMVNVKTNFAGIHRRLRIDLGKAGRHRDARRMLLKAGNFEGWSEGPVHVLSSKIVKWCVGQGAGELVMSVTDLAPALPWDRLGRLLEYKCGDAGIEFSIDNKSAAAKGRTIETEAREVKKQTVRELRKLKREIGNLQGEQDGTEQRASG